MDNLAPAIVSQLPKGKLLLPYQQQANALLNTTALLVIEKSRRIGLTWGIAAAAVLNASKSREAGGSDSLYISYSQEMTREFVDACAMWARAFNFACSSMEEFLFKQNDEDKAIAAFRIKFNSGFEVVGLSSAPRALRGKQGLIIIDEAAFVDSLAELLKAAMAMMIWGGRVVVISTHNGVDNPFNVLLQDVKAGRRDGKVMKITFSDAIAAGLYDRIQLVTPNELPPLREWIAKIRATYGDDASEELDCIPKAGAGSWLNAKDLAACAHPDAGKPELYDNGPVFGGGDIARRVDLAVYWPFELVNGDLWLRERVEMQNARFADQYSEFDRLMRDYRILRFLLDQSGMGEAVVERHQDKHGSTRVQGVIFTPPNRLDMATALRERVEAHTILLPDDPVVQTDLRSIKRTAGTGGAIRLAEDGSSDAHADRFWAAALACLAARTDYQPFEYISQSSLPKGHHADDHSWAQRGLRAMKGMFG